MEELKEQIVESLETQGFFQRENYCKVSHEEQAAYILTLFQNWLKKELDGLEVIGDERIKAVVGKICEEMWSHKAHPRCEYEKGLLQAQLDDVKKHFKEMK